MVDKFPDGTPIPIAGRTGETCGKCKDQKKRCYSHRPDSILNFRTIHNRGDCKEFKVKIKKDHKAKIRALAVLNQTHSGAIMEKVLDAYLEKMREEHGEP